LFFVTGKEDLSLTAKEETSPWFNELLKRQDVSKDVLLYFKKHYLTSNDMEVENEEI
jgi:hypothetical protein